MNNIVIWLFFLFSIFLSSCFKTDSYYIYEYNPQKAGVDIVKRITVPAGNYISYTNNHYYLIGENKMRIYDLSDDEVVILKELSYDLTPWKPEDDIYYGKIIRCGGIMDLGDKIVFMVYIGYRETKYLFSIDSDGRNFGLSDLTADISSYDNLSDFYYDNTTQTLYAGLQDGKVNSTFKYSIDEYVYNTERNHFERKNNKFSFNNRYTLILYPSVDYVAANYFQQTNITNNRNLLSIYNYNKTKQKEMNLMYLHLNIRPLSVFIGDDGNIWLYVREYDGEKNQDKYELLKLKLLE